MRIPLPRSLKLSVKRMLASPLITPLAAKHAGISTCLNYHRITTERFTPGTYNPNIWLSVHRDCFEEQIRLLSERCICLTLPEAVRLLAAGRLPVNSVTITFDDGYRDNLTLGLPILEKYGVPATIFATTGLLDRTANLWWEEQVFILERLPHLELEWRGERYEWDLRTVALKEAAATDLRTIFKQLDLKDQEALLNLLRSKCEERFDYDDKIITWSELQQLARHPLITIGAHTRSHPVLSRLTEDDLASELTDSKRILENRINQKIDLLAYPIGQREHASVREFKAAKAAGFTAAFTSRPGHLQFQHADHLHCLPRIPVDYFDTLESLRWKLSGFEAMVQSRGRVLVTD